MKLTEREVQFTEGLLKVFELCTDFINKVYAKDKELSEGEYVALMELMIAGQKAPAVLADRMVVMARKVKEEREGKRV